MEINIKSGGYKKMNKLDKNIKYPHFHRNIFIIETKVLFLMLIQRWQTAEVLKILYNYV
jgi:hypothetical protein